MKIIFQFFVSIIMAFGASAVVFSSFLYFYRRLYVLTFSESKRVELNNKIDAWWSNWISQDYKSVFDKAYNNYFNFFQKSDSYYTKFFFYSFIFTLASIIIGNFFGTITQYLYIYHSFPMDIYKSNLYGNIELNDFKQISNYEILSLYLPNLYYNLFWFIGSSSAGIIMINAYNKNKNINVVYSFIVIYTLACIIIKLFTIWGDILGGREFKIGYSFNILIILNILFFIKKRKDIEIISDLLSCFVYVITILIYNFLFMFLLNNKNLFTICFIDGLLNRFFFLFIINFFFDMVIVYFISRQKTNNNNIYFVFKLFLLSLVTSILSYIVYTSYICIVQSLVPSFAVNPGKTYSIINFIIDSTIFEIKTLDISPFFWGLSSFIPVLIILTFVIFTYVSKWIKYKLSFFIFYIYHIVNDNNYDTKNIGLLPYILIILFVSFLSFIGIFAYTFLPVFKTSIG